jgi:phage baseplate assembly protein W
MNLNFPYQFDGRGRTQNATVQDYLAQLVEQVLFTSPGDRVNMPSFGSGLRQLAFAPNSVELEAATQFAVQAALQKWLAGSVTIQSVVASAQEAVLSVTVTYSPMNTDVSQVQTFTYGTNS